MATTPEQLNDVVERVKAEVRQSDGQGAEFVVLRKGWVRIMLAALQSALSSDDRGVSK